MNYYSLLKVNRLIRNHRIKFLGLFLFYKLKKRYLAVHFDPVNACNLRCRMCYFSDDNFTKNLKGIFDKKDLPRLGEVVLKQALKLQIGCGKEPTLYKDIGEIIKVAKDFKVPHVSLTTNANLLTKDNLLRWAELGLDEIIVSLHGVYEDTYNDFMQKADYKRFLQSLSYITEVKKIYPDLSLRINYTFNEDNFNELKDFFKVFGAFDINKLQLRPINNLGNTSYQNFKMDKVIPVYDEILSLISKECKKRNITLIAAASTDSLVSKKNKASLVHNYTYCYISPTDFWHEDLDWRNETYNDYVKRKKITSELLRNIFSSSKKLEHLQTENLNYKID
ncbi:MAG: radical SAM protein [Flavobacteriia bacterium]|nr:MAG: radical SAM protein [Flavobacteriia bacterium]